MARQVFDEENNKRTPTDLLRETTNAIKDKGKSTQIATSANNRTSTNPMNLLEEIKASASAPKPTSKKTETTKKSTSETYSSSQDSGWQQSSNNNNAKVIAKDDRNWYEKATDMTGSSIGKRRQETNEIVRKQYNEGTLPSDDVARLDNFHAVIDKEGNEVDSEQYFTDYNTLAQKTTDLKSQADKLNADYESGLINQNQYVQEFDKLSEEFEDTKAQISYLENNNKVVTGFEYYDWAREHGKDVGDFERYAEAINDGAIERLAESYTASLMDTLNTPVQAVDWMHSILTKGEYDFTGENTASTKLTNSANELREYAFAGATGVGKWSLQTLTSLMPMLNAMTLGYAGGIIAGVSNTAQLAGVVNTFTNAYLGMGTAGQVARQRINEGNDLASATLNGLAHGLITAWVEGADMGQMANIFTGNVSNVCTGMALSTVNVPALIARISSAGRAEAFEELMEATLDFAVDSLQNRITDTFLHNKIDRVQVETLSVPELAQQMLMAYAGSFVLAGSSGQIMRDVQYVVDSKKMYNASMQARGWFEQQLNSPLSSAEEKDMARKSIELIDDNVSKYIPSILDDAVTTTDDMGTLDMTFDEAMNQLANALQLDFQGDIKQGLETLNRAQELKNIFQQSLDLKGVDISADTYVNLSKNQQRATMKNANYASRLGIGLAFKSEQEIQRDFVDKAVEEGMQKSVAEKKMNELLIDGYYDTDTQKVVINANSNMAQVSTLVHELTHMTEGSGYYESIADAVKNTMSKDEYKQAMKEARSLYKKAQPKITEDGIKKEFVAQQMQKEAMLGNEEFLERMVVYNESMINRIMSDIKAMTSSDTKIQLENNFINAINSVQEQRETGEFQYAVRNNKDYMNAVKNDDRALAQEYVDETAMMWGAFSEDNKPKDLYHGTKAFGFTRWMKEFLNNVVFLTDDVDTAQTYTMFNGDVKDIGQNVKKKLKKSNHKAIASMLDIFSMSGNKHYSYLSNDDIIKMTEKANENAGFLRYVFNEALQNDELKQLEIVTSDLEDAIKMSESGDHNQIAKYAEMILDDYDNWGGLDPEWETLLDYIPDIRIAFDAVEKSHQLNKQLSKGWIDGYNQGEGIYVLFNGNYPDAYSEDEAFAIAEKENNSKRDRSDGIYRFYAKANKPLYIEGQDSEWNRIPVPDWLKEEMGRSYSKEGGWNLEEGESYEDFAPDYMATDQFVEWAMKYSDYDAVIFDGIRDAVFGGDKSSTVYAIINYDENIRSADPVTYDDNGKVIPLSKRFSKDPDFRYSVRLKEESQLEGDTTSGEQEYNNVTPTVSRYLTVAPLFNTQVNEENYEEVTAPLREEFKTLTNDLVSSFGGEVVDITENVGGYTNDAGEVIREPSFTIETKNLSLEDAKMVSSLLGDLVKENQESVIAYEYSDLDNSDAVEYVIKYNGDHGMVRDILAKYGFNDFTQHRNSNTIALLDFEKSDNFEDSLADAISELQEGGLYDGIQNNPVVSSLIDRETRQASYRERLGAIEAGEQSGVGNISETAEIIRQALANNVNASNAPNSAFLNAPLDTQQSVSETQDTQNVDMPSVTPAMLQSMNMPDGMKNYLAETWRLLNDPSLPANRKQMLREIYDDYIRDYGAMEQGENPRNNERVPQYTDYGKVSAHTQTIVESGVLEGERLDDVKSAIADNRANYEQFKHTEVLDDAKDKLNKLGNDDMFDSFMDGDSRLGTPQRIADGYVLLEKLANDNDPRATDVTMKLIELESLAGQTLNASRLLKKLTPEGQMTVVMRQVRRIQNDVNERMGKKAPELKPNENYVTQFYQAKTETERARARERILEDIYNQVPNTLMDKLNAWRYLAMLGNPRTHIRNILGNAMFAPVVSTKNAIGSVLESMFNLDTRTKSMVNPLSAEGKALIEYGEQMYDQRGTDKDHIKYGLENTRGNRDTFSNNNLFGKGMNKLVRFNSNALNAEDNWFKKSRYAWSMAEYMKANNLTPGSMTEKQVREADNYAYKECLKATYNDVNTVAQALNKLSAKSDVARFFKDAIVPFTTTPFNIVKRGVEYSPAGLVSTLTKGAYDLSRGKINANDFIDRIASGMTGSMAFVVGMWLRSLGILRTKDDDPERKQKFDEALGEQDYSIQLPGSDKTWTVDWLEPVIMPIAMGAEAFNAVNGIEGWMGLGSAMESLTDIATKVADPVIETSMLSSLQSSLKSYANGGGEWFGDIVASALSSYIGQFVPTALGQVARTVDDTRRTTYPNNGIVDKTLKQIRNKMPFDAPFLGSSKDNEPLLNAKGEEVKVEDMGGTVGEALLNAFSPSKGATGNIEDKKELSKSVERLLLNAFSPSYMATSKRTENDDELYRLYDETGDVDVFPSSMKKSFTYQGTKYDLTGSEYTEFNQGMLQMENQYVNDFIDSPQYQTMTDDERVKTISNIREFCYKYAKDEYLKSKGVDFNESDMFIKANYDDARGAVENGYSLTDFFLAESAYKAGSSENKKADFIDYLNSTDMSPAEKNYMYDTQYGDSKFSKTINSTTLTEAQKIDIKMAKEQAEDTNAYARKLKEMGVFDYLVKYCDDNGIDYSVVGLNKTTASGGYTKTNKSSNSSSSSSNSSGKLDASFFGGTSSTTTKPSNTTSNTTKPQSSNSSGKLDASFFNR